MFSLNFDHLSHTKQASLSPPLSLKIKIQFFFKKYIKQRRKRSSIMFL